jgi:hypothetical protein
MHLFYSPNAQAINWRRSAAPGSAALAIADVINLASTRRARLRRACDRR